MRLSDVYRRSFLFRAKVKRVTNRFHKLFYNESASTFKNTTWLGAPLWKCPLDLWMYQEIIFEVKPDVIIECGTAMGGSALFLASMCDLVKNGRILTVDLYSAPYNDVRELKQPRPLHPRIEYFLGSSTDPKVVEAIKSRIKPGEKILVILDSDHSKKHVLEELNIWSPLVTSGSYIIVEDSNINGNPVNRQHGPGPHEALTEFLTKKPPFSIDKSKHKYFLTFNPDGYLKRE